MENLEAKTTQAETTTIETVTMKKQSKQPPIKIVDTNLKTENEILEVDDGCSSVCSDQVFNCHNWQFFLTIYCVFQIIGKLGEEDMVCGIDGITYKTLCHAQCNDYYDYSHMKVRVKRQTLPQHIIKFPSCPKVMEVLQGNVNRLVPFKKNFYAVTRPLHS